MYDDTIDTIVAQATPSGYAGVGVVRLSGPKSLEIARAISGRPLIPRHAHYVDFKDDQELIDQGLCLYFPRPNSFTGEEVVEFQGHGGPVILERLIRTALNRGARMALPGEFSQRAFLNGKIDLTQAEGIADLIHASTEEAARAALHSMSGAFSKKIFELDEQTVYLRMYVEASIDFPEEEIDFLADEKLSSLCSQLRHSFDALLKCVKQGVLLKEGKTVAIAGAPNAGKSSLLNYWVNEEASIVTDIAGTTRDLIERHVSLRGIPLKLVDTAGIRSTDDRVESVGIDRALKMMEKADLILLLIDGSSHVPCEYLVDTLAHFENKIIRVFNKADLGCFETGVRNGAIFLSAKTGEGFEAFFDFLAQKLGCEPNQEGGFLARRRHLDALGRFGDHLDRAIEHLNDRQGELMAEDLRRASLCLNEMTGSFTPDDLLGKIFSSFCIGK